MNLGKGRIKCCERNRKNWELNLYFNIFLGHQDSVALSGKINYEVYNTIENSINEM